MTKAIASLIFLAGIVLISCNTSKNSANKDIKNKPLEGWDSFDKQANNGGSGLMPGNTIPAMLNAIGLGVTTLDMGVSISKDKKVLLSNEPFFNHETTTLPNGGFISDKYDSTFNLYKMDYDSIIKYDVGIRPDPKFPQQQKIKAVKPLLSDVFKAVKEYMMTARRPYPFFNIEIKTLPAGDNIFYPKPAEFVDLLMKVIKDNQMEEMVIIQSFDFRTLQYLHQHYSKIKTSMLIEADSKSSFRKQIKDIGFTPTIYSPEYTLVTDLLIQNCHELGMKIIPWTVNEKSKIEELKKMGVDGIITDYPNLFND